MKIYLFMLVEIATITIVSFGQSVPMQTMPCGSWTPYKDEKCIKLVNRGCFQTKTDAEAVCAAFFEELQTEDVPKLVTIQTEEKQTFLQKLLFKENEILDNIWLGLDLKENGAFRWNDGTSLPFANWAKELVEGNRSEHEKNCVQMESGEGVYEIGKWVRANCKRRNSVVCERVQPLTMVTLQNIVLNLRAEMEKSKQETDEKIMNVTKEANQRINDAEQQINKANQKIDDSNQKITQTEKEISEANRRIEHSVQKIKEANQKIDDSNQKITQTETEISDSNRRVEHSDEKIKEVNQEIESLKKNPVPVGFIYVQLPGKDSPTTLWPHCNWIDVSSEYAGLFFRVEGGEAASFGTLQDDNTRRLAQVWHVESTNWGSPEIPADGTWSTDAFTGIHAGSGPFYALRFRLTTGEVRPRNKAIKIWQRVN